MNQREKFSTPLEVDKDVMKDQIQRLVFRIDAESKDITKRLNQLRVTKLSLQSICKHEFEPAGATHGGQYERCHICGFEQRN